MEGLVVIALLAFLAFMFKVLGIRGRQQYKHGGYAPSDREREEREIRAILKGTDGPRSAPTAAPQFVADRTVRFACAECGELTPSNEIEEVKGRRLCAACREGLAEDESLKTYRE